MKEQVEVKNLKEGKYVIIDDEACVIKSISKSKPGKHGSAKARVEAIGLFDGQKRSFIGSVANKIYVPLVERKNAQVLSITGGIAQLMDMADFTTFEITIPEDLKDKVTEGEEVSYITALGKIKFDIRK
ncbi:Eukaryotic translation initiation factor 5A [Methanosarcina sp. MTP4]|uniref:translation initiation factor IF-5A n=1 Tax=Methanosarcina sp. MTP4 TaxID=1434100 RepID=UPI0006155430|nr:translation initiation factor IF-5A [Methanosarcina sp. MTP4]AKB23915.1 Eukaryotic translation initiation factor 5A [Methanosarcina sp. MTP4]